MEVGRHAIANIYNCKIDDMDNVEKIKEIIMEAANETKLHIVDSIFHKFSPIGISGVLILSESHLTIHTWPEYNFIAIDVFTCGTSFNPERTCEIIAKKFKSDTYDIKEIKRGEKIGLSRIRNKIIESE